MPGSLWWSDKLAQFRVILFLWLSTAMSLIAQSWIIFHGKCLWIIHSCKIFISRETLNLSSVGLKNESRSISLLLENEHPTKPSICKFETPPESCSLSPHPINWWKTWQHLLWSAEIPSSLLTWHWVRKTHRLSCWGGFQYQEKLPASCPAACSYSQSSS